MRSLALAALLAAAPASAQTEAGSAPEPAPASKPPHATAGEAGAAAQTGTDAWQAPTLTITRYDEHWTQLSDPTLRSEHWSGPLKYIPLGSDAWLTTGAELRARGESFHDENWGSEPHATDTYLWLRAVPYADLHVGRETIGARAFAQPILAYAVSQATGPSAINQTRLDMLQGFGDVRIGAETGSTTDYGATVRAGRQMVSLGTERLIGTRYGPNTPLAFDGARGIVSFKGGLVSLISLRPVIPGKNSFDDAGSDAKRIWGAYAVIPNPRLTSVDLYYLVYRNEAATFGGTLGREFRKTLGARIWGRRSGWHWDIEGMSQRGEFAGQKIRAWAVGAEVGKTIEALPLSPDFDLRFNVISGDRKAGDGRLGTFNALFPKGKYFGELTPVGPVNIVSVNPRVTAKVAPEVTVGLTGMAYWRYSVADGIYGVPGNLLRGADGSDQRYIGKQQEATISWQATEELELSASLSLFQPGDFIRETGAAHNIRMIGAEANFRF